MKKRIFVFEKDDEALQMIEHILQEEGYEVVTTNTEFGIFDAIKRSRPDVILLDLITLTPQGAELNRAIKAGTGIPHIPVVMLSAHFSLDAIKDLFSSEGAPHAADIQKLIEVVGPRFPNEGVV